jgi:hypothetical protein
MVSVIADGVAVHSNCFMACMPKPCLTNAQQSDMKQGYGAGCGRRGFLSAHQIQVRFTLHH